MSMYDKETGKIKLYCVYHTEFLNRTEKLYKTMTGARAAMVRFNNKIGRQVYSCMQLQDFLDFRQANRKAVK